MKKWKPISSSIKKYKLWIIYKNDKKEFNNQGHEVIKIINVWIKKKLYFKNKNNQWCVKRSLFIVDL